MNTAKATIYNNMITKASMLTIPDIKKQIIKFNDDMSDEAGVVLEVMLDVLRTKISQKDFISFCNSI